MMKSRQLPRRHAHDRLYLHHLDHSEPLEDFRRDVLEGLSATPKRLLPKYFYDRRGSALFERITETEEYYPTRTESRILERHAAEIFMAAGSPREIAELGSGSSTKTRWLLNRMAELDGPIHYIAVDISQEPVREFGLGLLEDYPTLEMCGLIAEYGPALDELGRRGGPPRLFLFLGSSLGNFDPPEAAALLRHVRATMSPQDRLLIGTDLVKPVEPLERAYNDRSGVTAAFNLNLLSRINRELGGTFDTRRFAHRAIYNQINGRIEMYLESLVRQDVRIAALDRSFAFAASERIHTENSYKYDPAGLDRLFEEAGLSAEQRWMDAQEWFAVSLVRRAD